VTRPAVVHPFEEFDPRGRAAVLGVTVARFLGADLHLFHAPAAHGEVIPPKGAESPGQPRDGGIRLATVIAPPDPAAAIARYADRVGAVLVVIDARYGESRRLGCSSVARRLAPSAPCPVLVVPGHGADAQAPDRPPFREVICAVDFSPPSVDAARAALAFVESGRGRLTLVHVMDGFRARMAFSGGDALRALYEYEERAATASSRLLRLVPTGRPGGGRVEPLVVSGVPHQMILRAAREAKADLVVMGLPARGLNHRPPAGSTSRAVLRRSRCPVLLVPGPGPLVDHRREALRRPEDANLTAWASAAALSGVRRWGWRSGLPLREPPPVSDVAASAGPPVYIHDRRGWP